MRKLLILLVLAVIGAVGWRVHSHTSKTPTALSSAASTISKTSKAAQRPASTACDANVLSKDIIVSISQQHVWACAKGTVAYDSAVITGMQQYPSELTPKGTYTIYAKQTNQTLAGHDFTGSWSDFVYYWMPFLNNQYGTYGFHDLTQAANGSAGRADSDFGNIDINAPYTATKHGSHGCVELPLAASKWLYDWAVVSTQVQIIS